MSKNLSLEETVDETKPLEEGGETTPEDVNTEETSTNMDESTTTDTETGSEDESKEPTLTEAEDILNVTDKDLNTPNSEVTGESAEKILEETEKEKQEEVNAEAAENEALEALAFRFKDTAAALEEAVEIVKNVEEATPALTQLMAVVGKIAVAGDPSMSAEEVVPSMESYVGKQIPTQHIEDMIKKMRNASQEIFIKTSGLE